MLRRLRIAACAFALVYAAIAGLRTIADPDVFWQLSTGRWIVQHMAVPRTELFSYTAHGREWIYPVLSQLILYLLYACGGYALLSWTGALASTAATAILLRKNSLTSIFVAIVAVPCIASRSVARAEMFSTLLLAVFASLLWAYHSGERVRLWILPLLMALWVNLHLGFTAGLAMCGAYLFLDSAELPFRDRRDLALSRLRRAWPYLLVTLAATLINPWGYRVYVALARQREASALHGAWIMEWLPIGFDSSTLTRAVEWREPDSAVLWLIAISIAAIVAAVWKTRYAAAFILAAATYVVIHAMRFQAPFACIVVVIGGSILGESFREYATRINPRTIAKFASAAILALSLLVTARIHDVATQRESLRYPGEFVEFGTGLASWPPARAARFAAERQLPRNLFHEYTAGGFVTWIAPQYPDYIDGRAIPFGTDGFLKSLRFTSGTFDSSEFLAEAERFQIHTAMISLSYESGPAIGRLAEYCSSLLWKPVYLGTDAALFVRVHPATQPLIDNLKLDCQVFDFASSIPDSLVGVHRAKNIISASWILIALGREREAAEILSRAPEVAKKSYAYHFARGILLQRAGNLQGAAAELREAAQAGFDDAGLVLARQYQREGRFSDASEILRVTAARSIQPCMLARTELAAGDPRSALNALRRSEKLSPFRGAAYGMGEGFRTAISEVREAAERQTSH